MMSRQVVPYPEPEAVNVRLLWIDEWSVRASDQSRMNAVVVVTAWYRPYIWGTLPARQLIKRRIGLASSHSAMSQLKYYRNSKSLSIQTKVSWSCRFCCMQCLNWGGTRFPYFFRSGNVVPQLLCDVKGKRWLLQNRSSFVSEIRHFPQISSNLVWKGGEEKKRKAWEKRKCRGEGSHLFYS